MSIVWMIYFAGIASSVSMTLFMSGMLSGVIYGLLAVFYCSEDGKFKDTHPKKAISFIAFCLITSSLIPPEKTVYMMAGASIAQDIASNPKTIATMDKVYKLIDGKLDEQIKQVAKDNKEK